MYEIFAMILIMSPTQPSPIISSKSHADCSHQFSADPQTSSWAVFLESGVLAPQQNNSNHHIKRLKHKLAELAAIIDFHKEKYVQDIFNESYSQIYKELAHLAYPLLILEKPEISKDSSDDFLTESSLTESSLTESSLAESSLTESSLLEAYSIYQRLALSIEVITVDLVHYHNSTNKMWRECTGMVDNILRNIYTELVMKDFSIPSPLTRNLIPDTMRCLPFSAERDTRDFIVLRHLLEATLSYSQKLEKMEDI